MKISHLALIVVGAAAASVPIYFLLSPSDLSPIVPAISKTSQPPTRPSEARQDITASVDSPSVAESPKNYAPAMNASTAASITSEAPVMPTASSSSSAAQTTSPVSNDKSEYAPIASSSASGSASGSNSPDSAAAQSGGSSPGFAISPDLSTVEVSPSVTVPAVLAPIGSAGNFTPAQQAQAAQASQDFLSNVQQAVDSGTEPNTAWKAAQNLADQQYYTMYGSDAYLRASSATVSTPPNSSSGQ